MGPDDPASGAKPPPAWKMRWIAWRNRVLSDPGFQRWASRFPLTRPVAKRRAADLFDLVAGFTYTQTVLATVESGLLDALAGRACSLTEIAETTGLGPAAAHRLIRAAAALEIAEEVAPGHWMLGQQGAALHSNIGARAMLLHHKLLYRDLADPLALLREDRGQATALSDFWRYAARDRPEDEAVDAVDPYSRLMAESQRMVAEQVVPAYRFDRHRSLLDVGGGHGVFLAEVASACPKLELGLFDLPGVVRGLDGRLRDRIAVHEGNFFEQPLPEGYDCISLVRILHDHDDEPALRLLRAIRQALPPDGRLVIAEPMAETRGAEAMGDAYFGLYLWAMRSGRPRTPHEIGALLEAAGFRTWSRRNTALQLVSSLIVAQP